MNRRLKGNLLVLAQFTLLGLLIFVPASTPPYGELTPLIMQVGLVSMFFGLFIAGLSAIMLGKALTGHPMPNARGELVTSGLYRFVRHPIYTGLLLLGIGFTLTNGFFPHIIFFALLVLLLLYKSNFEEQMLRERYVDYAAYAKRTGRFLPRLRK